MPSSTEPPAAGLDRTAEPGDPLASAAQAVGDRWTLLVVDALLDEPRRFGEVAAAVQGISTNVLSDRLRRLEADGLVVARPYSDRPARFVYQLTEAGSRLGGALRALSDWGAQRLGAPAGAEPTRRHRGCGGAVETVLRCQVCARDLDEADTDELRWV